MKMFLFLLPLVVAGAAHAQLTKCVYLNPAMTCTAGRALSTYNNTADWDATCTDSVATTKIAGVWRCVREPIYEVTDGFTDVDYYYVNNTYCVCMMVTPVLSDWVRYGSVGDADKCYGTCGRLCLEALQQSGATTFKTNMFNSLRP